MIATYDWRISLWTVSQRRLKSISLWVVAILSNPLWSNIIYFSFHCISFTLAQLTQHFTTVDWCTCKDESWSELKCFVGQNYLSWSRFANWENRDFLFKFDARVGERTRKGVCLCHLTYSPSLNLSTIEFNHVTMRAAKREKPRKFFGQTPVTQVFTSTRYISIIIRSLSFFSTFVDPVKAHKNGSDSKQNLAFSISDRD